MTLSDKTVALTTTIHELTALRERIASGGLSMHSTTLQELTTVLPERHPRACCPRIPREKVHRSLRKRRSRRFARPLTHAGKQPSKKPGIPAMPQAKRYCKCRSGPTRRRSSYATIGR